MNQFARMALAIAIFLSGAALIPFVELPRETFQWQRYAGVYEEPTLTVNHTVGRPGSFFTFTGTNFPKNAAGDVMVNDLKIGDFSSDAQGGFVFQIDTSQGEEGQYQVQVSAPGVGQRSSGLGPQANFLLDAQAALHPAEGGVPVLLLPPDIAIHLSVLPFVVR